MQIYNAHLLNNKRRFWKAVVYGLLAALGCAFVISYLMRLTADQMNMIFTILYFIPGYLIPKAIHKAGGGIGKKYAYLGAILTFLSLLLCDFFLLAGYQVLFQPQIWPVTLRMVFNFRFALNLNSLLSLLCIAFSIAIAYRESDITANA